MLMETWVKEKGLCKRERLPWIYIEDAGRKKEKHKRKGNGGDGY